MVGRDWIVLIQTLHGSVGCGNIFISPAFGEIIDMVAISQVSLGGLLFLKSDMTTIGKGNLMFSDHSTHMRGPVEPLPCCCRKQRSSLRSVPQDWLFSDQSQKWGQNVVGSRTSWSVSQRIERTERSGMSCRTASCSAIRLAGTAFALIRLSTGSPFSVISTDLLPGNAASTCSAVFVNSSRKPATKAEADFGMPTSWQYSASIGSHASQGKS